MPRYNSYTNVTRRNIRAGRRFKRGYLPKSGGRRYVPTSYLSRKANRPTRRQGMIKGSPFPQKLNTTLTVLERNGLISALTPAFSKVYRPTSYFDFDPAVGGQTFGGYGVLAQIYDRYRVLAFKVDITFINLESDSVTCTIEAIGDAVQPPSGTATDYTEYAIESSNFFRKVILGPTSSAPKAQVSMFTKCLAVWGTPEVSTDAAFAAAAGTSPQSNTWLRISAYRNNGVALTVGVQYVMKLTSYGYWDEKIDLIA